MSNLSGRKLLDLIHAEAVAISNPNCIQRRPRFTVLDSVFSGLVRTYPKGDAARDGKKGKWERTNEILNEMRKEVLGDNS